MDITISVVEDNNSFRSSLIELIKSTKEFTLVSEYSNAENAINITRDDPNIAIIDIELPGMNGIDLIKKIRSLNNDIEFLICSSYDDDEKIFAALEAGASGYILKDSTSTQIISAIKDLYNSGSPMSPSIARRIITTFQSKKINDKFLLTEREKEVLHLLSKGLVYKQIADELFISHETVKKHLKNIYQKLQVQNKIEALNKLKML